MQISEKELQEKLFNYYGTLNSTKFDEEIELKHSEFVIPNKRFDLVGVGGGSSTLYIIELKVGIIDANALCQLLEYISILKSSISYTHKYQDIRGVLIGLSVDDRVESVIDKLDNIEFMTYSFELTINNESTREFTDEYLEDVYTSIEKILPDKYKLEGE